MRANLLIFLAFFISIVFCFFVYYLGMLYLSYQVKAWANYLAEAADEEAQAQQQEPPAVVVAAVPVEEGAHPGGGEGA